jgi:taurine dioxygenase/sulfonate dioxygenase
MAPSVAEIPEKQAGTSIVVPSKATAGTGESTAKVRRVIDEEEGKTPASVRI